MHEMGPFSVKNNQLMLHGSVVTDPTVLIDVHAGKVLAYGDDTKHDIQKIFTQSFTELMRDGKHEHAQSLMPIHYSMHNVLTSDEICSIINYEANCKDYNKIREIAFAKDKELKRKLPAYQRMKY